LVGRAAVAPWLAEADIREPRVIPADWQVSPAIFDSLAARSLFKLTDFSIRPSTFSV